jgi:hypothetical protein
LVSEAKAKEAFLLAASDLSKLATADHGSGIVLALEDVRDSSFAKWGGEAGLEAEFDKRKKKALAKFEAKKQTDKPMKKKPKVATLSSRPMDDLAQIKFWAGNVLPIGFFVEQAGGAMAMVAKCKDENCHFEGSAHDGCIQVHRLMDHPEEGRQVAGGTLVDIEHSFAMPPAEGEGAGLTLPEVRHEVSYNQVQYAAIIIIDIL